MEKEQGSRYEVIDWKQFDWNTFTDVSKVELQELKEQWNNDCKLNCDGMLSSLTECIQSCVEKVAVKKVVFSHSKPWINRDIAEKLKKLRQQRKRCRNRKSRANISEYERSKEEITEMITKAEEDWWLSECEKLETAGEREK